MKVIYYFLLILMVEMSNELRIFQEITHFFKKLLTIGKDINVEGYILSLQWIRMCIYKISFFLHKLQF